MGVKTVNDEYIHIGCAFYKKCNLPKRISLCYKFPDFTICPEYNTLKDKLKSKI